MTGMLIDGEKRKIQDITVLYGGRKFSEEEVINALSFWLGEWSEEVDVILSKGKWEEMKYPVPKWFSEVLDWLNKITVILGK